MGKKKNKRRDIYDLDVCDQMIMLEKITEAISGESELSVEDNESYEEESSDGFFDMIGRMVAEKTSTNSFTNNADHYEKEYNMPNNNVSHSDDRVINELTVTRSDNEFRLVRFSDGIRDLVIDLNSLSPDKSLSSNDIELNDLETVFDDNFLTSGIMKEVIPNFYPTIITTVDRLNKIFEHISDIDYTKFHFYEYPDNHGSIVIGYYLSEQTVETLDELSKELYDSGYLISFLCALKDMACSNGFSFANLTDAYSKQLMLTTRFVRSGDNFIERLLEDEDTEKDDSISNDSIFDAITVFPFYYEDEYANNILSLYLSNDSDEDVNESEYGNFLNESEDYEDDEDDDEDDEVDSDELPNPESSYNDNNDNIYETNEHTTENETVAHDDLFDGVNTNEEDESEDDESLQDEAERLEEEYFGNKKSQRISMKSGKKMKNDNDDFVVPRYK